VEDTSECLGGDVMLLMVMVVLLLLEAPDSIPQGGRERGQEEAAREGRWDLEPAENLACCYSQQNE